MCLLISDICGGLGNAMFMYIVGKSIAAKYNYEFKYFISEPRYTFLHNWYPYFWFLNENERIYDIPQDTTIIDENITINIYHQFDDIQSMLHTNNVLLHGYWQDNKLFDDKLCREIFNIPTNINDSLLNKYGTYSDMVHVCVRRGDYVSLGIDLPFSWYDNAIKHYFPHRKLVITSDDIDWCKHHFNEYDVKYIDNSDFIEQMWAGTLCKDHVIADSSFGWWQAYLSDANKVVCPTGWRAAVDGWRTEDK